MFDSSNPNELEMKLLNVVAWVAFLAAGSLADQVIWDGADSVGHVASGGYWWKFDDAVHSGKSKTNFPDPSKTVDSAGLFAARNGGMFDLTYSINPSSIGWSYAAIGFNWVDPEAEVPQTWTTICLEYSMDGDFPIRLEMKNDYSLTQDNDYSILLPMQPAMKKTCFPVKKFAQQSGGKGIQPFAACMAKSKGMKLNGVAYTTPSSDPLATNFKLKSITVSNGIAGVEGALGAGKMRLSRRLRGLAVAGMETGGGTVELRDSHGRLLKRESLSSGGEMDVSGMSKGLYLVRVRSGGATLSEPLALL